MKTDTPAARRWRAAYQGAERAVITSWPQALRDAHAMTDKQLDAAAQGCTDVRCVRHGAINHVRRDRGTRP